MESYTWIDMLEKMQDLRLFCKLNTSRSKKSSLLSSQELDFLSRVALSEEKLSPSRLSSLMNLPKPVITHLIEQAEDKKLILKESNSNDKRGYLISITSEGKKSWKIPTRIFLLLFINFTVPLEKQNLNCLQP